MSELTAEQKETIHELQREIANLNLKADIAWAKYLHTNDQECWTEVQALEGEIEMKGLIAYIPKVGEHKISKIRKLIGKIQGKNDEACDGCDLGVDEVRLSALASVNEWRSAWDLPPLPRLPQGTPGDAQDCTLAQAFRMSLYEIGADEIDVEVGGGNDISIQAAYTDGEGVRQYIEDTPEFGEHANTLIQMFDENAWLDLLDDHALENYANVVADSADADEPGRLLRLEEISEEYRRRGMASTSVTFYGDANEPVSLELGSSLSVAAQVAE